MGVHPCSVTLPQDWPGHTVSEVFADTVGRLGDRIAFRYTQSQETVSKTAKAFAEKFTQTAYTWNEYNQQGRAFAKALIAHKVKAHDVVTIQGSNSPQWLFANIGAILAGGVSAGIYTTNSSELCKHIVTDSNAKVVVVEDEQQLEKYQTVASTALKCIVVWSAIQHPEVKEKCSVPVYSWDEFMQTGAAVSEEKVSKRIRSQTADQPCSLIYTSGTTGSPKGATLTHDNLTWTATVSGKHFSFKPSCLGISYLPLSHISAQQLDCIVPLIFGHSIDIAPKDALKGNNLMQHIVHARPTYFLAVPRVWEKFKEGMEAQVAKAPFMKRVMFQISSRIAKATVPDFNALSAKNELFPLTLLERVRFVFERSLIGFLETVVFKKIKTAIGLDRCTLAASGAGPLNPEISLFFTGLNMSVIDLFGMSESSGPTALPNPVSQPAGSCGQAIPGTEIRIFQPDEKGEGEIVIKGRHLFRGYWGDEATTRKSIDKEGFFHTGDRGRLDEDGHLFLTGRIKELIKTSGGENIPPVKIEQTIKGELPIVSQAVVIGERRNFLTCLVTLKTEVDSDGSPTERLAPEVIEVVKSLSSSAITLQEASGDPKVMRFLMQGIHRANERADSQAQHVQKITVLPQDFSVANGQMTATLKLKRSVIEAKYQKEIHEMYSHRSPKLAHT